VPAPETPVAVHHRPPSPRRQGRLRCIPTAAPTECTPQRPDGHPAVPTPRRPVAVHHRLPSPSHTAAASPPPCTTSCPRPDARASRPQAEDAPGASRRAHRRTAPGEALTVAVTCGAPRQRSECTTRTLGRDASPPSPSTRARPHDFCPPPLEPGSSRSAAPSPPRSRPRWRYEASAAASPAGC
jgi:hypothetical protein